MTVKTGTVYVATETFVADVDGAQMTFHKDRTRVREGHDILAKYATLFKEVDAHYEVEDASAAPGAKRER